MEHHEHHEHHHHDSRRDVILEVLLRVSTAKTYSTLPFTDVRKHLEPIAVEIEAALDKHR